MKKKLIFLFFMFIFASVLLTACNSDENRIKETFTVTYYTQNGIISGDNPQIVERGVAARPITAVPNYGYEFVRWSDGYENSTRFDFNIQSDMVLYAEMRKRQYTWNYHADIGGTISGKETQILLHGEDAETVIAVPDPGRTFLGWSDGLKNPIRQELNVEYGGDITAYFSNKAELELKYEASTGGEIIGKTEQTIEYGDNGTEVTAQAFENYAFVKWSDGLESPSRRDLAVSQNMTITAEFERIFRIYSYQYNHADNADIRCLSLMKENIAKTTLPVPVREGYIFGGWYLDWTLNDPITDETGKIVSKRNFLDDESDKLYAKWTAKTQREFKILMAYVTEIDAVAYTKEMEPVVIKYKMTDFERQINEILNKRLVEYLNVLMDGSVTFSVDVLYTTETIRSDQLNRMYDFYGNVRYGITAQRIPEIYERSKDYESVITTFSLNDFECILQNGGGQAGRKFATVHGEGMFIHHVLGGRPLEELLDFTNPFTMMVWDTYLKTYVHEFIHTIESWSVPYSLHNALESNYKEYTDWEIYKMYLWKESLFNGDMIGIDPCYWEQVTNTEV